MENLLRFKNAISSCTHMCRGSGTNKPAYTAHSPTATHEATAKDKSPNHWRYKRLVSSSLFLKFKRRSTTRITAHDNISSTPTLEDARKLLDGKDQSPQHKLLVLHVAHVIENTPNLRNLVVEVVRLVQQSECEDVAQVTIEFATQLITAFEDPSRFPNDQTRLSELVLNFLSILKSANANGIQRTKEQVIHSIRQILTNHYDLFRGSDKKDSWLSCLKSECLGPTLSMLHIIHTSASIVPVPMVQPLIGIIAGLLQATEQACSNYEWMRWLSVTAAEFVVSIAAVVGSVEKPRKEWLEAIDVFQKKLFKIVKEAQHFSKQSVATRFLQQGSHKNAIEFMKEDLKNAIHHFNIQTKMSIKADILQMARQIEVCSLETLPRLTDYDVNSQHGRYRIIQEESIKDVLHWIEDSDGMTFFWIQGAAGIGKSTLAHGLFDILKSEGLLASFAFFSIGNSLCPKDLVRMMARELCSLHPGSRMAVALAIDHCSGVHHSLEKYLIDFIAAPISTLGYAGPLVIIIDGLDEWDKRLMLLDALRRINLPVNLKFVITSRYSPDIEQAIEGSFTQYQLAHVSEDVCYRYFKDNFLAKGINGVDEKLLHDLVVKTDGYLMWAATVFSRISIPDPKRTTLQILENIALPSFYSAEVNWMDDFYREALERILPHQHARSCLELFLSMMALREALPLREFSRLIDLEEHFVKTVYSQLRVLQTRGKFHEGIVQPATQLFHTSFIEYLGRVDKTLSPNGVMAVNCTRFFVKMVRAGTGFVKLQEAEHYVGNHWMDHLWESPSETKGFLETFPHLSRNHICVRGKCLLPHIRLYEALKPSPEVIPYIPVFFSSLGHTYIGVDAISKHRQLTTEAELANNKNPTAFNWTHSESRSISVNYDNVIFEISLAIANFERAVDCAPLSHPWPLTQSKTRQRWTQNRFGHIETPQSDNIPINLGCRSTGRMSETAEITNPAYPYHHEATQHSVAIKQSMSNIKKVDYKPDASLPGIFSNLGVCYSSLFERTRDITDISRAIKHFQQAVQHAPYGHGDLPQIFSDLSKCYLLRFEHAADPTDINLAIAYANKATRSAPPGHPCLPLWTSSLGDLYQRRFEQTADIMDFRNAIDNLWAIGFRLEKL
ncbi:Vegetative incompatibility protein HET-E-1 [Psilocybe cubensis]|uniref:Vegetative incompatibility protein HET-E-1 n=2 Tax=Psilocybe cubensis TaxID=181762 RepID=A0ACB8HDG8_PSICU|nr:Vegetative incompatibility protein HET-E-1 [Psilocybe cubensis]KAH9485874.1 Vegetative incompatibility protein HET-E-1 [Psilocybe cubensis]